MPFPVFRRLLTWTLLTACAYDILHEFHPNCGQLKAPTGDLVLSYLLSATTHAVHFNLKQCIHDFPHSKWVFMIDRLKCVHAQVMTFSALSWQMTWTERVLNALKRKASRCRVYSLCRKTPIKRGHIYQPSAWWMWFYTSHCCKRRLDAATCLRGKH